MRLLILILVSMISCHSKKSKVIKSKNFIVKDSARNIMFKVPNYNKLTNNTENYFIKNDSVFYKYVFNHSKETNEKVKDVVDVESFDLLYNDDQNIKKINNQHYLINPILNYFEDKNNIYLSILVFQSKVFY